jgi:hypothetical protein
MSHSPQKTVNSRAGFSSDTMEAGKREIFKSYKKKELLDKG